MADLTLYPTIADYPNATGINQILYPLRDSITLVNPFFAILFSLFVVLTISSYYAFATFTGKTRMFNSLLASSFVTFLISIMFSMGELITPYHTLMFLGLTVISYIALVFYKT